MSAPWVYLVELTGYTSATDSAVYRYATGAYITQAADNPSSAWYEPRVMDAGSITRTLLASGTAADRANPRAEVAYGLITLANINGDLDAIFSGASISFRERQARVLRVRAGAAYSTADVLLVATISQAHLDRERVTIGLKDRLYELDSPHLTASYGGTNALPAGVDGVDDIKGKLIPKLYGKAFEIPAVCVNTSKLIYQVSARALQSVDAVEDGGHLGAYTVGAAYSSQSDMETNAPTVGQYRAWLAGGMVRLGSSPALRLTVDATADSAGNSTVAQLLRTLALDRGIASGDIDAADVAALDADNSAVCGLWVSSAATTLELMDQVARSVGAVYRFDRLGKLRMQRLEELSGNTVASLARWNVGSVDQLQAGEDLPVGTVRIRYARYHQTLAGGDIGSGVSDADRADLAQEWRVAEYAANPSPNPHKRLQTLERDTCLAAKADAQAEAQRLHALTVVPRRTHKLADVQLDDDGIVAIDVGAEIALRWDRFGFSEAAETPRLVTQVTSYLRDQRADLLVWGA